MASLPRRYIDSMPLGACDPVGRLQLLDKQGRDVPVTIHPGYQPDFANTLGRGCECEGHLRDQRRSPIRE